MKMLMEIDYKTKIKRISYLIGQALFIGLALFISPKIACPFKKIFHIPCPFCGMTRSIYLLLNIKVIESIKYNILTIPLVLLLSITDLTILFEIVTNKNIYKNKIYIKSKIPIISILLIISIIWGIINKI